MPAANLFTDEGLLSVSADPGSSDTLKMGGQHMPTMANATNADNCNVHVALFTLLGVALIVLLRKNGIHALSLEG